MSKGMVYTIMIMMSCKTFGAELGLSSADDMKKALKTHYTVLNDENTDYAVKLKSALYLSKNHKKHKVEGFIQSTLKRHTYEEVSLGAIEIGLQTKIFSRKEAAAQYLAIMRHKDSNTELRILSSEKILGLANNFFTLKESTLSHIKATLRDIVKNLNANDDLWKKAQRLLNRMGKY